MTFILFQRGATSLGFQIGRVELSINYPRYWLRRKLVQRPGACVEDLILGNGYLPGSVIDWRSDLNIFRFKIWPK